MGSPFDGEAAIFPGGQVMPGRVVCARYIAMSIGTDPAADTCRHPEERFARQTLFVRAPVCRDHMFSQALRSIGASNAERRRGRVGWGYDRAGFELPRRDCGGDHALS